MHGRRATCAGHRSCVQKERTSWQLSSLKENFGVRESECLNLNISREITEGVIQLACFL